MRHQPSRGEQAKACVCVVLYSFYLSCLLWGSREDGGPFKAARPTGVVWSSGGGHPVAICVVICVGESMFLKAFGRLE